MHSFREISGSGIATNAIEIQKAGAQPNASDRPWMHLRVASIPLSEIGRSSSDVSVGSNNNNNTSNSTIDAIPEKCHLPPIESKSNRKVDGIIGKGEHIVRRQSVVNELVSKHRDLVKYLGINEADGVSMGVYFQKVFDSFKISRYSGIVALELFERCMSRMVITNAISVSNLKNTRLLFLTLLVIACKLYNDIPIANISWAKLSGEFTITDVNACEKLVVEGLSYDLAISEKDLENWTNNIIGQASKKNTENNLQEI